MTLNKVKNFGLIALFGLLIIAVSIGNMYQKKYRTEKAEKQRIAKNYKVVQDSVLEVKGENGLLAFRLQSQELTIKEIKTYYSNIEADLKDMKINIRKVVGMTAFNTEISTDINSIFESNKDSTSNNGNTVKEVPLETLNYSDKWFDISIKKQGLDAKILTHSRDSLIQVVFWDYTGKLWITKFLTKKAYWQDIKSMNPNSLVKYALWIEPVRNKRFNKK